MESKPVSKKLLTRLPVYLHYLKSLPASMENISATRIAEALNLGHVMVRKDLAKVSNGGRRRVGYLRDLLIQDIEDALSLNCNASAVVVGSGRLGLALLEYEGFETAGLDILAGFHMSEPEMPGQARKPVYPLEDLNAFCRHHHVRIGIITVPEVHAQRICDQLVACGVEAIWNFSSAKLLVPAGILLKNENLVHSLTTLRLQLKDRDCPRELCS